MTAKALSITAYIYTTGTPKVKCAIYSVGATYFEFLASTEEKTLGATDGWVKFNFPTPPSLTAGAYYCLCVWANSACQTYFFSAVTGDGDVSVITYGAWPSLLLIETVNKISIYCTLEGPDPLSVGVPVDIGTANAQGSSGNYPLRDHVHRITDAVIDSVVGFDLAAHASRHLAGGDDAFPWGSGGGLNVDLLDGKHASEIGGVCKCLMGFMYVSRTYNSSGYFALNCSSTFGATESDFQASIPAGTLKGIRIRCSFNNLNGTATITLRRNGANAYSVTYNAGETGVKTVYADVACAVGDLLNWSYTIAGSSGSIRFVPIVEFVPS